MGDFEVIQTGFSKADETINFGSRTIASESLFEISTLTSFKSDDEFSVGVSDVVLNSILKNGHLYLSIGKMLKVFKGAELSEIIFHASLGSTIVCMAVHPDKQLLVVCLETGVIKLLKIEEDGEFTSIFSRCLIEGAIPQNVYVDEMSEDVSGSITKFLVIFQNGTIFRISVNETNTEENRFLVDTDEIFNLSCEVNLTSFLYPLIVTNGSSCNVFNVETHKCISDKPFRIKKMFPLRRKFLCLDFEGKLRRLCGLTMKYVLIDYDFLLEDFLVLQDGTKILAVTKPNEIGEFFLQLLEIDFKQVFSLKLKYTVHLVDINSTIDDVLFVSYIKCLNEKIRELRLQTVYETEPESRYNRLVQRQRFDEAEAFAKVFNLNPSVVLKARAQFIVDKTECSSEDINTLITLMDSIDESYFNLRCCLYVDCLSFEDVRRILNYGFKISPKKWDESKEDILCFKKNLLARLYRWYTFTVLTKNNDDIQSWLRFSECSLLEEIKYCLKHYQIEDAILIYNRMDEETIRSLNDDFIDDILEIFAKLPQELLLPFLPTFVVRTMTHLPAVLPLVVNWLHNKILFIEKKDKVNFPENGINMVEGILKLITIEERTGTTRCMRNRKSLDDLSHLSKGLQILKKLKKDYGIVVELIEYLNGPKAFISTLLKISLPPELYDDFLKKILYVYLIQNDMEPDTIFEEEIKKLLTYDDSWISTIEIVIRNIDSLDIKLNLTHEILLKSPIPWCDVTKRIAYRALEFSHPLCEEISNTLNNEARLKVIKNDKYSIKKLILDEDEEEFHRAVNRIIYVNEPQMIDDIFHLCKTDDQYLKASFILANHFILKGDFDQAISIVDRNKAELINSCAMKLFDYVEIIFEKTYHNTETKEKYYNVLPYLMKIVRSSITEEWKMNDFEKYYRLIRGAYYFNKLFGTDFTARDFLSPPHRKRKYNELIETVVRNLNFASLCFNDIFQHSEKIAYYLSEDKDEVLLRLCDCIKNYDILIKVGEYLNEKESSAKNLSLMTTLFMKYLGYQDSSPFNATLFDNIHDETLPTTFGNLNCEDETSGIDKFLKGLKLGEQLITKAMVNGNCDLQIYEISNWINSCFYLIRPESTLHKELYPNLYCPKNMPSSTVLRTVQGCYQGFVDSIDTKKDFYSDYYKFFSTDTESQEDRSIVPDVSSLSSAIVTFCKEGQQLTAFSLLRCLTNSLLLHPTRDNQLLNPLTCLLRDTCVLQLIPAVISAENIDLQLLYNLFLEARQSYRKYLVEHLQIHMRNDRKLNDLSRVGIMLLNVHNETKGRESMINSVKCCKWWRRLFSVHSKMTYNEFFVSTAGTRLRELINLEAIGVEDIRLYCRDFNLEVDDYFKEYLRSSLVNFKPKYDINKSIDGKRILVMKDNENVLSNKCRDIINLIKDKKGTNTILEKMLKEVNFYYYEVFSVIYELLDNDTQISYCMHEGMLQFLMGYTRFSGPGQREIEEWTTTFPDAQILDPLSEFRFPFTPLLFTLDIWNILRPEIDLDSYKFWFDAESMSETLKINDICVYAVKQLVSSGILGNKSNEWIPQSQLGDLLVKVDECLQYMTNLEQAASAVYHLLNSIPNGADKVKAAELCMKYAIRYREENVNNQAVEQAFVKVKNKFYNLSVWNILYKFNLANENYLRFFMQPEILIENLYMDERISKQPVSSIFKYSDINDAVEALSELFKLDIQEIRFNILNRWLSSSQSVTTNTDVKFTLPTLDRASNQLNNDENLKRASYICTSGDQEYWESYLLHVILDDDESLDVQFRTSVFKANAAKCFCNVSDEARIVEVINLSYKEFLNYVDKLSLVSELESLGISLTIETLNAFSKRDLLKKLSHMGKPLAIKCMGTICITYFLDEPRYWEYIINSCIKLGMISQLKIYVDFLKDKCEENFYINAWQVIIDKSFQQIAHVSEDDLEETLFKNFLMIQSCPAVFSLNFEKIVDICVNLKKSEYAFLIVQYIPEEKRTLLLKEILKNKTDFSKLDSLKEKGLWGTYTLSRNNKLY